MTQENGKKIGIRDIAEKAGVSIGTVDRVLHMRGDVSEATKKRVLEIVKEYGYTPNVIARTLSSKKPLRIGIVIPDSSDHNPYWEMPIQGISKAASELSRFNTVIIHAFFDASDASSFRDAFDRVLAKDPDGMVLNPVFGQDSLEQISVLDEAGIPYVSIEVNVEGIDKRGHFGQDAFQSGRVAASIIETGMPGLSANQEGKMMPGSAESAGLNSTAGPALTAGPAEKSTLAEVLIIKQTSKKVFSRHIEARINGFLQYFSEKQNPVIRKSEIIQKEEPQTEARAATDHNQENHAIPHPVIVEIDLSLKDEPGKTLKNTLAQHPNARAVFIPNSRAFLFADFIEKNHLEGYFVVGYDIIEQNIQHLEKGTIDFLIGQKPQVQAYNAIMALSEHLLSGREIPEVNYSQIDIINKENITYYKNS